MKTVFENIFLYFENSFEKQIFIFENWFENRFFTFENRFEIQVFIFWKQFWKKGFLLFENSFGNRFFLLKIGFKYRYLGYVWLQFLFSIFKNLFLGIEKKTIFLYFCNQKHVWLVKKIKFFEGKNRKYWNMLLLGLKLWN